LAAIAVVVVLLAYFAVVQLLAVLVLLLLYLSDDFGWLLISAERALHHPVVLELVLGPLHEAVQVEGVAADGGAGSGGVALHDLHVADGAEVVVLVFILLLDDHVAAGHLDLGVLQELGELVVVDPAVGDDVPQFLVGVLPLEEQAVLGWEVEDLNEHVEGVRALAVLGCLAGALELVAYCDFELDAADVFEYEAGPAGDAGEVELVPAVDGAPDALNFQLFSLAYGRFRHLRYKYNGMT
jgi:hypothetical protein